jgi:hypothetical protein
MVEMAIPFSALSLGNSVRRPRDLDIWRINFSRIEWDIETAGDGYQKKRIHSLTVRCRSIIGFGHHRVW